MRMIRSITFVTLFLTLVSGAHAQSRSTLLETFVDEHVLQWCVNPWVVTELERRNAEHSALSESDISRLETKWRSQFSADRQPLVDEITNRTLSRYLRALKRSYEGAIDHIVVVDEKGLQIAASDAVRHFWHGDLAKTIEATRIDKDVALRIDEKDNVVMISIPVIDPETESVLGAMTLGLHGHRLRVLLNKRQSG